MEREQGSFDTIKKGHKRLYRGTQSKNERETEKMKRKPSLPPRAPEGPPGNWIWMTVGRLSLNGRTKEARTRSKVRNHPVQPLILRKHAETLRDFSRGVRERDSGLVSCFRAILAI